MKSQHISSTIKHTSITHPYAKAAAIWISTLIILALAGKVGEYAEVSMDVLPVEDFLCRQS